MNRIKKSIIIAKRSTKQAFSDSIKSDILSYYFPNNEVPSLNPLIPEELLDPTRDTYFCDSDKIEAISR